MGTTASISFLTEDVLDEYTTLTFLTRGEILNLFKTFSLLGQSDAQNLETRYSIFEIEENFPQIKCNPFKDRIIKVFSSQKDGLLSFEDVLDLYSVMSHKCPDKVKALWAFRIFDYDEDGAIGEADLMIVIDRLTASENSGNQIDIENKKHIIQILLKEMDLEHNGFINQLEFQHAIGKIPEFSHSFSFRF